MAPKDLYPHSLQIQTLKSVEKVRGRTTSVPLRWRTVLLSTLGVTANGSLGIRLPEPL
jgi:hypothetical protein